MRESESRMIRCWALMCSKARTTRRGLASTTIWPPVGDVLQYWDWRVTSTEGGLAPKSERTLLPHYSIRRNLRQAAWRLVHGGWLEHRLSPTSHQTAQPAQGPAYRRVFCDHIDDEVATAWTGSIACSGLAPLTFRPPQLHCVPPRGIVWVAVTVPPRPWNERAIAQQNGAVLLWTRSLCSGRCSCS